jgi:hypothetical protein
MLESHGMGTHGRRGIADGITVLGARSPIERTQAGPLEGVLMIIHRRTAGTCALALAAALSITGCAGRDDGGTGASPPPASSPPAAEQAYTPEQLEAVLLTAADLGEGWTETQRGAFTNREPENPSVEDSLSLCPQAAEQAKKLDQLASDAGADVELEQAAEGGSFHLLRQQAWSDDQVQEYFTTLNEAITLCVGSAWEADGNEVKLEALEAPALGDESTSVAAVATLGEGDDATTWTSRLTVARFGTALMAVSDSIVGGPAPEPAWSTIAQAAGDQFAGLAG